MKKGPWHITPKVNLTPGQRVDPFFKDFYSRLKEYLQKVLLIQPGSKILCGVSGGVDSIVMLDALSWLAQKYDYRLAVVHVNHKLRGNDSDRDEEHVKSVCKDYGLYYYVSSIDVKEYSEKHSLSTEEAARKLRYNYFDRIANSINASNVALAHTADDNAETVLFNLLRGTGLTGLGGIPPKRILSKKVFIVRPFMEFHKSELIEYAEKRELRWYEDETNALLYYTRNKIRHELIPKIEKDFSPTAINTINRSSKLIRGADEFISSHISEIFNKHFQGKKNEKMSFEITFMKTNPEFIQGELIQQGLQVFFNMNSVSMKTIDRIFDLMNSGTGNIIEIGNEIVALNDRGKLIFSKQQEPLKINKKIENIGEYEFAGKKLILERVDRRSLSFKNDPNVEIFDMEFIPKFLYIRNWEEGDRFSPLGMKGTMKVSDFLTNEKVSLIDKKRVYVLSTKTDIIWVIGMRISEKYKIRKDSKKILRARLTGG